MNKNSIIRATVFIGILLIFWGLQRAFDGFFGDSIIGVILFLTVELVAWIALNVFLDSGRRSGK